MVVQYAESIGKRDHPQQSGRFSSRRPIQPVRLALGCTQGRTDAASTGAFDTDSAGVIDSLFEVRAR